MRKYKVQAAWREQVETAWKEFKATRTPFELSLEQVAGLEWRATCMTIDLDQHEDDVDEAKASFKEALAAHSLAFSRSVDDYQTDFDNHEVKCNNARRRIAAAASRIVLWTELPHYIRKQPPTTTPSNGITKEKRNEKF